MSKKWIWIAGIILVIALFGRPSQDVQEAQEGLQAPTVALPTQTAEAVKETPATPCGSEYAEAANDVIGKLPEAINVALIDALIQRYDNVPLPECGNEKLLADIDVNIRLALANRLSANSHEGLTAQEYADKSAEFARIAAIQLEEWASEVFSY